MCRHSGEMISYHEALEARKTLPIHNFEVYTSKSVKDKEQEILVRILYCKAEVP